MTEEIFLKLDLGEYLDKFNSFLARQKPLFLQGDSKIHFENINELSKYDFKAPDEIKELDDALMRLSKQAVLHISEIYEFAKIIKYFSYLKKQKFEGRLGEWIAKVEIPEAMSHMANSFDENGEFSDSVDERFAAIKQAFSEKKRQIDAELKKLIYSKHITPYLVDTQTHYINSQEALLVRGGFNHALKGTVIARSSGGYFYVAPANTERLKRSKASYLIEKRRLFLSTARNLACR